MVWSAPSTAQSRACMLVHGEAEPLCKATHLAGLTLSRVPDQLEAAATAGVVVVLAVIGIVMYEAISTGLPGLASGDVPIWSLKVRRGAEFAADVVVSRRLGAPAP